MSLNNTCIFCKKTTKEVGAMRRIDRKHGPGKEKKYACIKCIDRRG